MLQQEPDVLQRMAGVHMAVQQVLVAIGGNMLADVAIAVKCLVQNEVDLACCVSLGLLDVQTEVGAHIHVFLNGINQNHGNAVDLVALGNGVRFGQEVITLDTVGNALIQTMSQFDGFLIVHCLGILGCADQSEAVRIDAGVIAAGTLVLQLLTVAGQHEAAQIVLAIEGLVGNESKCMFHHGFQSSGIHLRQMTVLCQHVNAGEHPQPAALRPCKFPITEHFVTTVVDAVENTALLMIDELQPVGQEIILNLVDIKCFEFLQIHSNHHLRPNRSQGFLSCFSEKGKTLH